MKDCEKEHCHCHDKWDQQLCTSDITFCEHCQNQPPPDLGVSVVEVIDTKDKFG